jgi:hypothetical protein
LTDTNRLVYGARMKKKLTEAKKAALTEAQKAARLLGSHGGGKTLAKFGHDKLVEWGRTGGRPKKPWKDLSESGKRARRRRKGSEGVRDDL